jgi:hypothetical protein
MFASKDALISGSGGGYPINNSLRFRSSATAYLNRTPASVSNRTTWTWSGWVKRGALSTQQALFSASNGSGSGGDWVQIVFDATTNGIDFIYYSSAVIGRKITTPVYRDPSSWYHIVAVFNTTSATGEDRMQLWINGVRLTASQFSTNTILSQNTSGTVNAMVVHETGALYYTPNTNFFDGYMAEVNFIDGQALTPSSFGAYSATTGVWQPALYTGSYGTNGFYLKFASFGTAAALGNDSSGNGNTWTVNNISVTAGVTYDPMLDSPTLTSATVANYCVINAVDKNGTIINGNLTATTTSSYSNARATFGVSSGKWYWEQTIDQVTSNNAGLCQVGGGVALSTYSLTAGAGSAGMWGFQNSNGAGTASWKFDNGTGTNSYTVFTTGDIAGFALDMGAGTLAVYRNNTLLFTCSSSLSGNTVYPNVVSYASGQTATSSLNFGQRAFSYTPPTGFVALNAYNLPTPTIANGATVMAATTYTGTGASGNAINNGNNTTTAVSFQPDFVWIKCRSVATTDHALSNVVAGFTLGLSSNNTGAEFNQSSNFSSANSNGFTVQGSSTSYNQSSATYVAWQWKAGNSSGSSNTNGSITSTVSVNATAGFSVVTFTGTGVNATVGHGLGVAPSMVIVKNRTNAFDWAVGHSSLTSWAYVLNLNNTIAQTAYTGFNNTAPTSSVFSLGAQNATNQSTANMVAYCWSAVAGYSAFGSYTGNGSTDGPFIYLGLRARFIMIKRTDTTGDWCVIDTSRDTYNIASDFLYSNLSVAEQVNGAFDFLSNGIKMRNTFANLNASSGTYIYAAFAENPFNYALAR